MKILIEFLFIGLFSLSPVFAQNIGTWQNYTDMKNVSDAVWTGNGFWAATDGGTFYYDYTDGLYQRITASDGLSSQLLTSIEVDGEGKIWLGSLPGYLDVYNPQSGSIKKILDIYNSDKNQKKINDLFFKDGNILVGTDFGVSVVNTTNYTFSETYVKFGDFPAETKVNSIFQNNLIYVCTERGVAVQKAGAQNLSAPESWNVYTNNNEISANSVYKITEFDGSILLASSNGIYKLENNSWNEYLQQGYDVSDIYAAGDNLYYIANNILFEFSNNQPSQIYSSAGVTLRSIFSSSQNEIFVVSDKGVVKVTNGSDFLFPNGPLTNSIQDITVDNDNNVWVGSGRDVFGAGIFEFTGTEWINYTTSNHPELPSNYYHRVYAAPDNSVYFANWGFGFTRLKAGVFETFNASNTDLVGIPNSPNFVVISSIYNDSQNNAWFLNYQSSSRKPLNVLTSDGNIFSFEFPSPRISESEEVEYLVVDQFDKKWFAVTNGDLGLYYYDDKGTYENTSDDSYGYITTSDGLNSNIITALATDKRGTLWIGSNEGVNVITDVSRPKSSFSPLVGISVRQQVVTCIAVDPLDRKWIGTKQGIFLLSEDGFTLLEQYNTENSPLPSNDIKSIAIDGNNGVVYIGTDFGMASFATDAVSPQESFTELFVYPNPVKLGDTQQNRVTIRGLVRNSQIKILSVTGNLVKEFITPGGNIAFWDGTNDNGKLVASGVYIVVASDEEANQVATTKVAVIRE